MGQLSFSSVWRLLLPLMFIVSSIFLKTMATSDSSSMEDDKKGIGNSGEFTAKFCTDHNTKAHNQNDCLVADTVKADGGAAKSEADFTAFADPFFSAHVQIEEQRGFPMFTRGRSVMEAAPSVQAQMGMTPDPTDHLPQAVLPEHYTIWVRPILDDDEANGTQFTTPGSINILVNCHEKTRRIVLHKHPQLVIDSQSVAVKHNKKKQTLKIENLVYDETKHFYQIFLVDNLVVGKQYEIFMRFIAPLYTAQMGIYQAFYKTPEGVKRYFATTQFQFRGFRKNFPSFDEPGFKATFDISIGRTTDRNSWSNSPKLEEGVHDDSLPDGWVWDKFATTVKMSTYVIGMIVADFECVKADSSIARDIPMQVCGPSNWLIDRGGGVMAAEALPKYFQFLEQTLGIEYPMPKMDYMAIPDEFFPFAAMENFGLIISKAQVALYYPGEGTEAERWQSLSVILHETAHQWLGNIVTCAQWENIWLNEGLTSHMMNVGDDVFSEFEGFSLWRQAQYALQMDVAVNKPVFGEIDFTLSFLAYEKGASLAKMMGGFLGKETLAQAIASYLQRYAYKGVNQDQFFGVLNEFGLREGSVTKSRSVNSIMDTWTRQPGYPVVKLSKKSSREVHISQEHYFPTTDSHATVSQKQKIAIEQMQKEKPKGYLWEVPIWLVSAKNPNFTNHAPDLWLSRHQKSGTKFKHDTSSWIMLNPDGTGYYRVLYDDHFFNLILAQLDSDPMVISAKSRSQLIDDYFSFAKYGHVPLKKALDLTTYLDQEDDYLVWYTMLTNLKETMKLLGELPVSYATARGADKMLPKMDPVHENYRNYWISKIDSALDRLLDDDWQIPLKDLGNGNRVRFAARMLDWSCALGSEKCRALAKRLVDQWKQRPRDRNAIIPPDFQLTTYCAGVASIGKSAYNFIFRQYTRATPGTHRTRYLSALACTRDPEIMHSFILDKILNLGQNCTVHCVDQTDANLAIQRVASSPLGRQELFQIIEEHWQAIITKFGLVGVGNIVAMSAAFLTNQQERDDLAKFMEDRHSEVGLLWTSPVFNLTFELADTSVKWTSVNYKPLKKWLKNNF